MRGIVFATVLWLLCTVGSASAELVLWEIDGSITSGTGPYVSSSGPFPVGSTYSAQFTVDLNSPLTPNSGVANFEGAIQSFNFSILSSGYSYSSSQSSNQGVSITPNTPSGDVIYFYMPAHFAGGPQPNLLASFFFIDPSGTLSTNPDLHGLFNSFNINNYSFMQGSGQPFTSGCALSLCGSMQFSITSASVAPVPLPSSATLLASGLALFGWLARFKRTISLGSMT